MFVLFSAKGVACGGGEKLPQSKFVSSITCHLQQGFLGIRNLLRQTDRQTDRAGVGENKKDKEWKLVGIEGG